MDARELQTRAIRGSVWTAIHTVVSVPIAFVANAIVARILGPAAYGELAFLTLSLALVFQASNLGFSDAAIQWGAAAEARGRRPDADAILRKSLGYHVLVQLPIVAAGILFLARNESPWIAVALIASAAITTGIGSSSLAISIENKTAAGAKLVIATNVLLQASLVGSAALTESSVDVWAMRSVAASVLLPLNLFLLDRARRRTVLSSALPRRLPPGFWRFAMQSGAAAVLATLVFSRSEIFLLRSLGDAEDLGQFALAFGLAAQVTAPVDALLGPLVPAVAGLFSSAADSASHALARALRFSALFSGAVLALLVVPLYFLLPLIYGDAFARAQDLFLPLAATSCLQSALSPVLAFLYARRRGALLVRVYIVALVVDVGVAVVAIPPAGAWGAVAANIAGQAVVFLSFGLAESRAHGWALRLLASRLRAWAAGAAALGVSFVVIRSALGNGHAIAAAVAGLALAGVSYLASLRMLHATLTSQDAGALQNALPRALVGPVLRVLRAARLITSGS